VQLDLGTVRVNLKLDSFHETGGGSKPCEQS
jgi:hypothetical protein